MRRTRTCLLILTAAIALTALYCAANLWATPAVGFTTTTLVKGTFGEIDVLSKSIIPNSSEDDRRAKTWLSMQKTSGPSDLYVQTNIWQPGGTTGWHIHPGHSLIIVTEGTVTEYDGSDPDCKPHVHTTEHDLCRSRRRPRPHHPQRRHRHRTNHHDPTHPRRCHTPHRRRRPRKLPLLRTNASSERYGRRP